MDISVTHDYQIDLDSLLRFFSEEELIAEKYNQLAAKNVKVLAIKETEDGFSIATQRDVPANVPLCLKVFLAVLTPSIKQRLGIGKMTKLYSVR